MVTLIIDVFNDQKNNSYGSFESILLGEQVVKETYVEAHGGKKGEGRGEKRKREGQQRGGLNSVEMAAVKVRRMWHLLAPTVPW